MIVIIGASGAVGIPLIKELTRRDTRLRVLTSNSASAKILKSLGQIETIIVDFHSDEDVKNVMKNFLIIKRSKITLAFFILLRLNVQVQKVMGCPKL